MAAGNVIHAAIGGVGIIEANPASEVFHWCSPSPVGVILMPGNDSAMTGRFTEELIVKKAKTLSQQLVGSH